jgi:hypothetical protein
MLILASESLERNDGSDRRCRPKRMPRNPSVTATSRKQHGILKELILIKDHSCYSSFLLSGLIRKVKEGSSNQVRATNDTMH